MPPPAADAKTPSAVGWYARDSTRRGWDGKTVVGVVMFSVTPLLGTLHILIEPSSPPLQSRSESQPCDHGLQDKSDTTDEL